MVKVTLCGLCELYILPSPTWCKRISCNSLFVLKTTQGSKCINTLFVQENIWSGYYINLFLL